MHRTELINARKKLKLTQEEVSKKAGISRVSYAKYEIGLRTPSVTRAKLIADVLKSKVDKIFLT